jgi:hypothetical protein
LLNSIKNTADNLFSSIVSIRYAIVEALASVSSLHPLKAADNPDRIHRQKAERETIPTTMILCFA